MSIIVANTPLLARFRVSAKISIFNIYGRIKLIRLTRFAFSSYRYSNTTFHIVEFKPADYPQAIVGLACLESALIYVPESQKLTLVAFLEKLAASVMNE